MFCIDFSLMARQQPQWTTAALVSIGRSTHWSQITIIASIWLGGVDNKNIKNVQTNSEKQV